MKARQDILDLKASVGRLAALDGAVVRLAEGTFLLDVAGLTHESKRMPGHRVRSLRPDVRPLIEEAHRLGAPTCETFTKTIETARPPSLVDVRMLSTSRRDLRRVSSKSARAEIAREPKTFRRYPEIDDHFLSDRENKLDRLGAARGAEAPAPGFSGVLALIESIRGKRAARRAREIVDAIVRDARSSHAIAIARLENVRSLPEDDELTQTLRNVARLPGRARARRVAKLLALAVSRPVPVIPADQPFERQVELAADALIRSFDVALPSDFEARVERCVGAFALLVRGAEREASPHITVADLLAAEQRLGMLGAELEGRAIDPAEAIALAVPSISPPQTRKLAGWIEGGLGLEEVRAVVAAGALDSLLLVEGDARVASAWASWVSKLVPHFRALGLKVSLDPAVLRGVRASQEELAVLAQCLIEHDSTEGAPIETQLAALDATLALFVRAPLRVRDAIRAVRETASGDGRARFPEFAAFVDDDARVDRFLHLARLAGESSAPSEALLEDCELLSELGRQLAHLEIMEPKADVHRARIQTLKASIAAGPPSPERTRRRLDARIRGLLPRAYRVVLEKILGEVLREAWGISPRKASPAWRDAVRFFLTIEDNREHLRTLLRHASSFPGAPVERTLPKNRAYVEEMRGKIDVEAFLAPKRTELVLPLEEAGKTARYVMQLEEDPIEVLRMGIPFDTCLSLTDGCNSASTVLNAIDANKRVLYVRDAEGAIVARKLLAISEDARLLGYRLYCSVPRLQSALEIEADSFCRAFAASCGLELADSGEPRKIHDGFWYDDGSLPWPALAPGSDVARYCEHLGRPVPELSPTRLCDEARRFAARESGDIERMIRTLPSWLEGPGDALLGDEVVARLGIEQAVVRAKRVDDLCAPIARALSKGTLSELATRANRCGAAAIVDLNEALASAMARFDDDASAIGPLISLARAAIRAGRSRGLAHAAFDLDRHFAGAEVSAFLDEADRMEKVWAHLVSEEPQCAACREDGTEKLLRAVELAYARSPDPDAVIATLRSGRASDLSRRLAIRIAARFPLDRDAPFGPFTHLARGKGRAPTVVSALMKLHTRERAFTGSPDLFAAVLRHGGPTGAGKMPIPRASPFESMRDLVFDPSVDALVEPFLHPQHFRPSRFELHVHRRVDGAFRQELRHRAIEGDGTAASWLSLLGDVAAVERAKDAGVGHVAVRHRSPMARAIAAARTRGGLDLHEHVVLAAGEAWPENAIDPAVTRSALALIEEGKAQLDAAVGTLRATKDPAWFDAVLSIAHIGESWATNQVRAYVSERISAASRAVDAVAWREAFLLSEKGWSSEVVTALARGHFAPFDVAADRACATWTKLGGKERSHALFRAWLGAIASSAPSQASSMENPARRDLLLDVVAERETSVTRAAFVAFEDFETLSRLLDRVGLEGTAIETSAKGAVMRSWLDAATQVAQEGV